MQMREEKKMYYIKHLHVFDFIISALTQWLHIVHETNQISYVQEQYNAVLIFITIGITSIANNKFSISRYQSFKFSMTCRSFEYRYFPFTQRNNK